VISVFRGNDYVQAQLLAGLLRQRGIDVFLQGALLQGGLGELPAMGHLSLMVDAADRVAAERIIAAYERGELAIDEEDFS
jgi:Putative prokaryotic signal transducing protein